MGAKQKATKLRRPKINLIDRTNKTKRPAIFFAQGTLPTVPHSNAVHQFATNEPTSAQRWATKACSKAMNTYTH
jgi:hypothetical protein